MEAGDRRLPHGDRSRQPRSRPRRRPSRAAGRRRPPRRGPHRRRAAGGDRRGRRRWSPAWSAPRRNLAARFTLNEQCIPQLRRPQRCPGARRRGRITRGRWGSCHRCPPRSPCSAPTSGGALPRGGTLGVYAAAGALGDAYVTAADDLARSASLRVVATERVDAASTSLPAVASIDALVAARPDVVLAAPDGLDCTWFLRGLAARRVVAPDWRPRRAARRRLRASGGAASRRPDDRRGRQHRGARRPGGRSPIRASRAWPTT